MQRSTIHCAVVLVAGLFGFAGAAPAIEDADCYICHGDPSASMTNAQGEVISLYVDEEQYSHGVHAPMGCVSCHSDIDELPHPADLQSADCSMCHVQTEEYDQSVHGQALHNGDGDVSGCVDCHGKHHIRPSTDPLSMTHPLNMPQTCGQCHSDPSLMERHMVTVTEPSDTYLKSVHGRALTENPEANAAVCNDCHGSHDILAAHDSNSRVHWMNLPNTCGQCHEAEVEAFQKSIHGRALAAGIDEAPTCTDCHGEHDIEPPDVAGSPVSPRQISQSTCPQCHMDERVMKQFGVETMRQASYMDSYHGLALGTGSTVEASCVDCHGAHEILTQSNPQSSIHPENLPQTCAKCHPSAGPNFAAGPVHILPTSPGQRAHGIVRLIYLCIIGVLLGFMVLHNAFFLMRHMLLKLRREMPGPGTYRRFKVGQVLAHLIQSLSFIVLAISGFALRYPNNWVTQWLFITEGGGDLRGQTHRLVAIVFVVIIAVMVWYLVFFRKGRKELCAFFPRWRDFGDLFRNIGYGLGLCKEPPKFGRHGYPEKLEFWGLLWGSVLMIVTGFVMWYAEFFMQFWPKVVIDIFALIHYYEAILAVGTILVWHFYFTIFDPKVYPMNWSWVTGRIPIEDLKKHHPGEYERVYGDVPSEDAPPSVAGSEPASGRDDDKNR